MAAGQECSARRREFDGDAQQTGGPSPAGMGDRQQRRRSEFSHFAAMRIARCFISHGYLCAFQCAAGVLDDGVGKKSNADFFHHKPDRFMQRDVALPDEFHTGPSNDD
jgi:hypothetical protein